MASRAPASSLIDQARSDWSILGDPSRKTEWEAARIRYNTAVAKLFDQLRCGPDGWDTRAAALGTRIAPPSAPQADIAKLDNLLPATQVNNNGIRSHQTTDGVGVPLVGWRKTSPVGQSREKFFLPNGLPSNLTATLAFDKAGTPSWNFTKRWQHDELAIGSATHTLAADWTAPNALYWKMCDLDDLKIQNVLLPDRFTEETGLYFVTPYDPEKIPVVFVHGLVSSPDAFKNIINEISPDPWFREHYQIWLYNYPTGNPWIYSSMKFREVMREACDYARAKGHDRNLNRMVVVAHSMGGLIARSSVTEPGTAFYDKVFTKPIDQLDVAPDTREIIRDTFLYQPLTEPERVVFMAVPHQGSPMASMRISNWISSLIRLPKTLTIELLDTTALVMSDIAQGEDPIPRLPTSINSLSPKNASTQTLGGMPLPKDIQFHSLIGDRGRNNSPDSSDGVVPYWSSHVAPVVSEKIVPCNHGVPDHPSAAAELEQILQQHLQGKN
jgi:hypothetical protein